MTYDWDGTRFRRIRLVKLAVAISFAVLVGAISLAVAWGATDREAKRMDTGEET